MNEYSFSNRLKALKEEDKSTELEHIFDQIYESVSKDKQEPKLTEKGY